MTDMIDPEVYLVGCVAVDPRAMEAGRQVRPEHFHIEQCRAFWQAATELDTEGGLTNLVAIMDRMGRNGVVPDRGFFMQTMEIVPTAADAPHYAALVRRKYAATRLGALGEKLSSMTPLADPEAMQALILAETEQLACEKPEQLVSSFDAVEALSEGIRRRQSGQRDYTPTGFTGVDGILGGGMVNAGLYLLAARPGMGKTTFALSIAEKAAQSRGVLYISLEMSIEQLTAKRLGSLSGVPARDLLLGSDRFGPESTTRLRSAADALRKSRMALNAAPGVSVADIARMARSMEDLSLIVIDHLGLLSMPAGSGSRYEKITELSASLKALAITLNVPILALCQLSRSCEGREDRRPELTDLRDSGSLEQDADGVFMLYRRDYYNPGEDPRAAQAPSPMECILRKNRHAGTGTAALMVHLPTGRITEPPARWHPAN